MIEILAAMEQWVRTHGSGEEADRLRRADSESEYEQWKDDLERGLGGGPKEGSNTEWLSDQPKWLREWINVDEKN